VQHAFARAESLAEACGDLQSASEGYAEAAGCWERFGVVPEQAFELLGQGRCLVRLARPDEAAPALQGARSIFQTLGAAPAVAETDELPEVASHKPMRQSLRGQSPLDLSAG
jgi:hypothetical protein